jgi:hypothetical protein
MRLPTRNAWPCKASIAHKMLRIGHITVDSLRLMLSVASRPRDNARETLGRCAARFLASNRRSLSGGEKRRGRLPLPYCKSSGSLVISCSNHELSELTSLRSARNRRDFDRYTRTICLAILSPNLDRL